mgnify:CR=1 FL=1
MPIYEYQGQQYDLPDGLSNEQAKAKIETYLNKGQAEQQPKQPHHKSFLLYISLQYF